VTAAVKQKTGALQSEVSAQQAIIEDLERKVAEQTRVSARAQPQKTVMPLEPKPRLGSFEMAKFANNLGTGTNIVDVYDDLKEKADYAAVASRGGQLRSPKDFAAVRDQVARQVRGDVVARAEESRVAQDLAKVAQEAKRVGGVSVGKQALHAVKDAMVSAASHVIQGGKVPAAAAAGDLPGPLNTDNVDSGNDADKYVVPSSQLSRTHLIRRLAAEAAPVGRAKLTAITRRALDRMQQSAGQGAEMI